MAVYGGRGRRRLSATAGALVLLGVVAACESDGSDREPSVHSGRDSGDDSAGEDVDAGVGPGDYEHWQPSYRDVRPARADDLQALGQRIVDLNLTSYTVAVPLMGLEVASAPDHVRVRFGEGSAGGFDLHLDPAVTGDTLLGAFVMCHADGVTCVEFGGEGTAGGGPHLFNNGIDSIALASTSIVSAQRSLPALLDKLAHEEASIATVDSPSGALDCLVSGGSPDERAQLEGSEVDLAADRVVVGDAEPLSTVCLEQHGLVVLTLPSLMAPVVPYGSFEAGVPEGFDDHADPVPYGSSPTASPMTDASPTSGAEAGRPQEVLVAVATIEVGESLEDALDRGKIVLDVVPAESVVPGALSSTAGLTEEVALVAVTAGQQLTEAAFGSSGP